MRAHEAVLATRGDSVHDRELLARLRRGDRSAMAELYDQYGRLVFSLALRILHDQNAAEETVQQVFVKIWRRAASYDAERARLSAWVAQIAHNQAIDELRKRRVRPPTDGEDSLDLILDASPTPHELAVQSIERHRILRALEQIPREQRLVIELAYYGGLTHQEIAEKLSEPLGTVKTRMRRGIQKLRQLLEPMV